MKKNHVREKLRAGAASVGCFLGLGSATVAELLAHAGCIHACAANGPGAIRGSPGLGRAMSN